MVNTNILLLLRRHYRQHHYRQHSPLQPLRLLFPLPFVDHETNIEERVVILHQELVRPAAAIYDKLANKAPYAQSGHPMLLSVIDTWKSPAGVGFDSCSG